jgi:adenine-specific DNA-methyltransferase
VVLRKINKRNGSNNLPNLKLDDENWKVRLIEEEFMKHMWDVEGK